MKVLLLTPYPPTRDGIGQYSSDLHAALSAAGHEVKVVSTRPSDRPEVVGTLTETSKSLARDISLWRPDVVHVQHAIAAYGGAVRKLWNLASLIRRQTNAVVVVSHHEVTRDVARMGYLGRAYYRWTARHTDIAHVHTAAAAAAYSDITAGCSPRISLVPHPIAGLPPATVGPRELRSRYGLDGRRIILCFGFIHVDKGLDIAAEALESLPEDVVLVVAGEVRPRPPLLRWYERADHRHLQAVFRRARDRGRADSVVVTGYVPKGEVAGWFTAADVVLLPYRRAEQSGVAQLALSAGAPILAAPTGGLRELFDGTANLLSDLDPKTVAAAIRRELADGRQRGAPKADAFTSFSALLQLYPQHPVEQAPYDPRQFVS